MLADGVSNHPGCQRFDCCVL